MNRAGRLVKILLLLQGLGQLTALQLAKKLEVSERQIYRDIDALTLWQVPIFAQSGHGGGYSLPKDYKVDPAMFTSVQVSTLSAGGLAIRGLSDFLEDESEIEVANAKLLSTLSETDREVVRRQIDYIYFDHNRWYRRYAYKNTLREMKYAVLHDRQIVIDFFRRYDTGRLSPLTTRVDAYGLVFKSDTWYLVGYFSLERRVRRWNVTRINRVQITEETFVRPLNFSLKAWWADEVEDFGKGDTRVRLRIDKAVLHRFERTTWKKDNKFYDHGDYLVVELMVDNYQRIVDLILVNRGDVIVLEPEALRKDVIASALRVEQRHLADIDDFKLSDESLVDFEIFSLVGGGPE